MPAPPDPAGSPGHAEPASGHPRPLRPHGRVTLSRPKAARAPGGLLAAAPAAGGERNCVTMAAEQSQADE